MPPADGKVLSIEQIQETKFIAGPALQITFATGLKDVHILRAPHSGQLTYIFVEQNAEGWTKYIGLRDVQGRKFLLGQVTPRRSTLSLPGILGAPGLSSIRLTAGQQVQQNEKIGVSVLGWQTRFTLTIPADLDFELLLRVGQHTQAAMTVLGRLD